MEVLDGGEEEVKESIIFHSLDPKLQIHLDIISLDHSRKQQREK